MIDVVKMRYDGSHSPLVASDPANCVLHDPDVRREALGAFLGNAFTIQTELFEDNAGYNEFNQLLPDHFRDDADDGHLSRVLRKVKPYTRVDQHPEHETHSILLPLSIDRPAVAK